MRLLLSIFLCLAFIPFSYGQTATDEATQDSNPASEPETTQKDNLAQIEKDTATLEKEISGLKKSISSLSEEGDKLLTSTDLSKLSKEITEPSLDQITKRFSEIKQLKENLETQKDTLQKSISSEEKKLKLIPSEINKLQTELSILQASPEPTNELESLTRKALITKLDTSIEKLNLDQSYLEKNTPTLKENLQVLTKDLSAITPLYNTWNDNLIEANKNTITSIRGEIVEISTKLSLDSPAEKLATQSIELSENLLGSNSIQAQLKQTRTELSKLKQTLNHINEQQKYAKDRITLLDDAGQSVDRATGTLLRNQRSKLRSEKDLKNRLTDIFGASTANELSLLTEREELANITVTPRGDYKNIFNDTQRSELTKEEYVNLVKSSKQLHKIIIKEREELSKDYSQLIYLLKETSRSSKEYSSFIDERLLWIVSHPPIGKLSFIQEAKSLNSLYGAEALSNFFTALKSQAIRSPLPWILFGIVFIIILSSRKKLLQWAAAAHKEASRGSCCTFRPTLIGLICDIALILPIPMLLAFIGWRTSSDQPLKEGILLGSLVYTIFGLMRRLCKKDGFFQSNSMLEDGHLRLFRKVIHPLYIVLPIVLITATALTKIKPELTTELTQGRLFNMLSLLILAASMHYILLPKKRIISDQKKPGFLSYLAYFTFVILPLILMFAAGIGYYISMLTLKTQLIHTIRVTILILFVSALLKRWLLVTRRHALINSLQTTISDPESPLTEQEQKQEIQDAVSKVSEQSNKLIRIVASVVLVFSLITIWQQTLPALAVLDNVELWETTSSETTSDVKSSGSSNPLGALTGTAASTTESTHTNTTYISLQDLLVTIIVSFLTYLAAVNIPSLLQITIFNHLKLKHGSAYAITTAIRYVIIAVGIIWAFGSIGVTWDKIQWLAAAITLGIGFGLQEIFANFVAGLILLFERPIRIGDLITVGEINGKVTKIQMRATTILQFNNRELIVPNKEFITGQLVNWTLTDSVIRVEIPVGIAYGSDTELAKSILLERAEANERILDTPQPDVMFKAFGGSSLDFVLRVFISSVDDLAPVQSELHFAIDNAYREAGIEIAFPQQDIHIRSIAGGLPTIKQEQPAD